VHPLEGNTTALVIGIARTAYGSLRIGFAAQNAMNTVWNTPYVHWPSHLDAIRAHLRGDRPADEDPLDALDALDDGDELGSGTEQLGRCLQILSLGRRLLFEIAPAGAEG
jgi:hypothetical protein